MIVVFCFVTKIPLFSSNINTIPLLDERIIEYDVDKVLFEKESPFQKVQIVHTKSVGNMLVLDELQSKWWEIFAQL